MNDAEIAKSYIRGFLEGAESDSWAPIELNALANLDPHRAWEIVKNINATPIEGTAWQEPIYSVLGGAIEELIVSLHPLGKRK